MCDSSWMVLVYSFPVFLSYGVVYHAGALYYATALFSMIFMCLAASGLSALAVMLIAVALPAGRIRTVSIFLGISVLLVLIMAIRMMRPEQLVNPDDFMSAALYLQSLETAGSPFLPSTWIYDAIQGALTGGPAGPVLMNAALAGSFAVLLIFINTYIAGKLYVTGFSKAQTSSARLFPAGASRPELGAIPAFPVFRGPGLCSQGSEDLFPGPHPMASTLPHRRPDPDLPLQFFGCSPWIRPLSARFICKISLHSSIWGLRPLSLPLLPPASYFPQSARKAMPSGSSDPPRSPYRTYLWIKFFMYALPLLMLSEILIVLSNILLGVSAFMMILSMATMLCMTPGVVAMGIGMGAMYPDFHAENPSETVTSFGGVLYMIFCTGFIALVIVLEAGPVYHLFMANLRGENLTPFQWAWLMLSFSLVLALSVFTVAVPMRLGERNLQPK